MYGHLPNAATATQIPRLGGHPGTKYGYFSRNMRSHCAAIAQHRRVQRSMMHVVSSNGQATQASMIRDQLLSLNDSY